MVWFCVNELSLKTALRWCVCLCLGPYQCCFWWIYQKGGVIVDLVCYMAVLCSLGTSFVILHDLTFFCSSNHVRLAATNALYNSLEFTKANFDKEVRKLWYRRRKTILAKLMAKKSENQLPWNDPEKWWRDYQSRWKQLVDTIGCAFFAIL